MKTKAFTNNSNRAFTNNPNNGVIKAVIQSYNEQYILDHLSCGIDNDEKTARYIASHPQIMTKWMEDIKSENELRDRF